MRLSVSAKARERARIAELAIEKELLQKQHKLKIQAEELKLEMEMAKARAREKIYSEDLTERTENDGDCKRTSSRVIHTTHRGRLDCDSSYTLQHHNTQEDHLVTTGALLSALALPKPEIPSFAGDLLKFKNFVSAFDSRIARHCQSSDRLYFLDQHLEGEPKEIIQGCLHMDPESGYAEARRLLDKEYGDGYKLSMTYLKQINDWYVLKQDDNIGLKQLSIFLVQCKNAMECLSDLQQLNSPSYMLSIVQKLPSYLQNKWRECVGKARRNQKRILTFYDLVEFIEEAADIANDPVYSRISTSTDSKAKQKTTSFASEVMPKDISVDDVKCLFCQGQHDIDQCYFFNLKSTDEKRDFLKENHLCFGCYGANHVSRGCTKRRECKTCGKLHPTALHNDAFSSKRMTRYRDQASVDGFAGQRDKADNSIDKRSQATDHNESGTCSATSTLDATVWHAILPVYIYQRGINKLIKTYCFYDKGSSGCFITNDLCEKIEAVGMDTRLQLKTMHGCSCIASTAVKDLVITDINGLSPINLPRTYTRDEIPVTNQHIPKPEMCHKWQHLHKVASELPEYLPDLEVGILVGNNCPAALEPLEVIPMNEPGPFAVRLRHGWTIHGPFNPTDSQVEKVTCNRIMMQEHVKELITEAVIHSLEMDFTKQLMCQGKVECHAKTESS